MNFLKYLCQTEILQLEFETRNKNNRDSAKSIRANVLCVFFSTILFAFYYANLFLFFSRRNEEAMEKQCNSENQL